MRETTVFGLQWLQRAEETVTVVSHVSVGWEASFRGAAVATDEEKEQEETFNSSLISLSHLPPFSLSGYRALSDFLFSALSPQIHMNNSSYLADPRLQTLPSFLRSRSTPPYCLPVSTLFSTPYRSSAIISCCFFFLFLLNQRQSKWIPHSALFDFSLQWKQCSRAFPCLVFTVTDSRLICATEGDWSCGGGGDREGRGLHFLSESMVCHRHLYSSTHWCRVCHPT